MIPVGIFTGYFPYTLDGVIAKLKEHGFITAQLDLAFKDIDFTPGTLTEAKCKRVRDAFRRANLPISAVSGYTNITHPDPDERRHRLDALKEIIRHTRQLGTAYVVSETGTFNTESDWVDDPKNKTEEGYEICAKIVAEMAQVAYDHGAVFLIENYVNNVIGSVEEVLRLFADVPHPGLGLLFDPTNFYDGSNIDRIDATLNKMFDALGPRIRLAHAKDCKLAASLEEKHVAIDAPEANTFRGAGAVELPAAGLGSLNYELYLRRLSALHPNMPLIIEHLDEDDVPRAKAFVDGVLTRLGC
jgi:sugar phosphate isomerase/epimerase